MHFPFTPLLALFTLLSTPLLATPLPQGTRDPITGTETPTELQPVNCDVANMYYNAVDKGDPGVRADAEQTRKESCG